MIIDESDATQADKKSEAIWKNLITADTQRLRVMHTDPQYIRSQLNFLVASNKVYSMIPVQERSRRFEAVYSDLESYWNHEVFKNIRPKESNTAEYFKYLYNGCSADEVTFLKTLANFLFHVPLDGWNAEVPMDTPLLAKNRESSLSLVQQYAKELVTRGHNNSNGSEWESGVDGGIIVQDLYLDFKNVMELNQKKCPAKKDFRDQLMRTLDITTYNLAVKNLNNVVVEMFRFKPLEVTREIFFRKMGLKQLLVQENNNTTASVAPEKDARENWLKTMTEDAWRWGFIPNIWRGENPLEVNFPLKPTDSSSTTSNPNTPQQSPIMTLLNVKRSYTDSFG